MKKLTNNHYYQIVCCVAVLFCMPLWAQDTLSIATYNLLKFPSLGGAGRIDDFRKVVDAIDPDILVVQELESQAGVNMLLNDVMNHDSNEYLAAQFIDGRDTDSGLFYRQSKVTFIKVNAINTDLRLINEYLLLAFGQAFNIYSTHFKAGSFSSNEQRRLNEATTLRNHLNNLTPNSKFMLVGDLNLKTAAEPAFVKLTGEEADNDGRLFDPIDQVGPWNNNSFFAAIHTQSTRTTSFGEGATGGMDDRFDIILVSNSLIDSNSVMRVLPQNYVAFGNDGRKFNRAINSGSNAAVPDSIADALHQASDHLPVVADFVFSVVSSIEDNSQTPAGFALFQNYPNPFNPTTTIRYSLPTREQVTLTVTNLLGEEISILVNGFKEVGEHTVMFDGKNLAGGIYFYSIITNSYSKTQKLLLLK